MKYLVFINTYINYLFYLLGIVLLIVLVILAIKIHNINSQLKDSLIGINDINQKLELITQKTEYIKQSMSSSWSFFISILAIIQIIKYVIKDYKSTPRIKRSMIKSCSKAIIHNTSKIKKVI